MGSSLAWDKEKIISELESGNLLPSISPLTMRLIELAADDNSSLNDIAALIEKDPSLTIRILKLANSVFFRYGNPAKTVQQAVVRIGVRQTRLLALSLLLKDTFPMKQAGTADYRRFWRLCLYQGLIAQSLAQHLKIVDTGEAFTAGFILEIGLLVFLHAFVDLNEPPADIPWHSLPCLLEWEKQKYGVNHRELGEFILTRWKFPASFILCQKPTATTQRIDERIPLVRVCAMASQLSAFICEPEAYLPEVFDTLELRFNLPKPLIHEVVITALQKVEDLAGTFEVEVDSERDTEVIMEKARAVLAQLSGKLLEQPLPSAKLPPPATSQKSADGTDAVRYTLEAVEHEIRNPLTAVGGLVRMLAKTIDPTSEQGGHIRVILSETERLEQALKGIGQMITPRRSPHDVPGLGKKICQQEILEAIRESRE